MHKMLSFLPVALLLVACSSMPLITDVDLANKESQGELESFYSQLQADLKLAKPESEAAENRQMYLLKVGRKIAEQKEQQLFDELGRGLDQHSIHDLQLAMEKAEVLKPYSEYVYNDYKKQIEQAIKQKRGVIFSKQAMFAEMSDDLAAEKVKLLDETMVIYGEGSDAEQVKQQREQYIASLFEQAKQALLDKKYDDVSKLLEKIVSVEPEYNGVSELRQQLVAAEFEQHLWDALENGQTDKAFDILKNLIAMPDYIANHPDVLPIVDDMIQFYVAQGDAAVKKSSIDLAYPSYSRAHALRVVVGKQDVSPGELKFIELVNKRLKKYVDSAVYVPAYGCMLVIAELQPAHPVLAEMEEKITTAVMAEARIKIMEGSFSSAEILPVSANNISAAIQLALTAGAQGRVQWIDAQSASTDYQATQIIQYANPDAYFVLAGNIRQANITVHDNTVTDVKHVLTGYEIKPNPEYQAWLLLDESVRGGVAAPAETIQVSMEEDVPVVKTVHEKKALLNMDYRLADAVSSKVLLSKVIEKNNSYTSENVAAVEKGLFVQPEVKGLEQSDADIFHDITRLVAGDVAQALLEEVIKLQASYLAKADQAVVTEDFAVAATYYAYGFALQRQAGKVDEALLQKLRLYSLRWK